MSRKDWIASAIMAGSISIAFMMIPVFAMVLLVIGVGVGVFWDWPLGIKEVRSFIWKFVRNEEK